MYTSYLLLGFICGFVSGMIMNVILLAGRPKSEVLENKGLRFRYGLLNWTISILVALIGFIVENEMHLP